MTHKGRAVAIWPVVMPFLNPLPGLTGKVRKPLDWLCFGNLALVSNFFFLIFFCHTCSTWNFLG